MSRIVLEGEILIANVVPMIMPMLTANIKDDDDRFVCFCVCDILFPAAAAVLCVVLPFFSFFHHHHHLMTPLYAATRASSHMTFPSQ